MPDMSFGDLNLPNMGGAVTAANNSWLAGASPETQQQYQDNLDYSAWLQKQIHGTGLFGSGNLGLFLSVLAPMLGPALGPLLGMTAGQGSALASSVAGAAGGASHGGGLQGALLGAVGGGLGSMGGNFIGSQLGNLTNGLTSGASNLFGSSGVNSLIGSAAGDTLGGAAVNTIAPVLINGATQQGLGGVLGGALGGAFGGAGGNVISGGSGDNNIGGVGGGMGSDPLVTGQMPGDGGNTIEGVDVTGIAPPVSNLNFDPALIASFVNGLQPSTGITGPEQQQPDQGPDANKTLQDWLTQIMGLTGPLGTGLPGIINRNPPVIHTPTTPSGPGVVSPGGPGGGGGGGTSGSPAKPAGGFAGVSPVIGGTAPGLINTGRGGSGAAPGGPGIDLKGSLSPDIYPWSTGAL